MPEGSALNVYTEQVIKIINQSLAVITAQLFEETLQAVDESLPPQLVSPIVVGIHQKGKKVKDKFAVEELLNEMIEAE